MASLILLPHLLGIDTRHALNFRVDRQSDPTGRVLLMCFRTPAMILSNEGLVRLKPGDCIIHDPSFRQLHYSVPEASEGFRNDWLHIRYDVVERVMEKLRLPWNKLLHTGQPDIIESHVKLLMAELEIQDEFTSSSIEAILFQLLLVVLRGSRKNKARIKNMTQVQDRHLEKMRGIRTLMLEQFQEPHKLNSLAKEMGLSPERFSALYRTFFKSSPIADIIRARLIAAQKRLVYSRDPIKEIAADCGFEDLHYFSRLFTRKIGLSPSRYREKHIG